jgi:hypothetical protein
VSGAAPRGRWLGLVAAGVGLYAAFLAATLPAAWMGELLARAGSGALSLEAPQGSFWNGSGVLTVRAPGGTALAAPLTWHIQPLWLFTGRLRARVEASGELKLNSEVTLAYRRARLSALEAELPAGAAGAFYAPALLVAPTGQLHVTAQEFELGAAGARGELHLTWSAAGSRLGGLGELGDYRLVVSGQGPTADLRLETLRGEVQLAGRGQWQASDGQLRLDGTIAPGAREPSLAPLLALLRAQRNGDQHAFNLVTRLPLPALLRGTP